MSKNENLTTTKQQKTSKQVSISDHSKNQFSEIVQHGLIESGIHVNASKNHGKTRLLFSMAQELRNLANCRVIIFDGSESWIYSFSRIPTFTVTEKDILLNEVKTTEEIERYELQNWNLVNLALSTEKDLLFRLKTRKPSKRGYFIRTVINYLDSLQRAERQTTKDHFPKQRLAFFVEEAQDAFNTRSTTRLESEEFLSVFNEGRNQQEAFFTASQRLTDFSKTMRTKQLYCIGKINQEDLTAFLRRLEKTHNLDFSNMKPRNWFFEGLTFESPTWKQNGKPFQINRTIKEKYLDSLPKKPQKLSLIQRLKREYHQWFDYPQRRPETELKPEKVYHCQSCGQECTKEEFEDGFCLDCDQIDFGI